MNMFELVKMHSFICGFCICIFDYFPIFYIIISLLYNFFPLVLFTLKFRFLFWMTKRTISAHSSRA